MTVATGMHVIYVDEKKDSHNALVIHVHSQDNINLVYVDTSTMDSDSYGNLLIRKTSVPRNAEDSSHFIQ